MNKFKGLEKIVKEQTGLDFQIVQNVPDSINSKYSLALYTTAEIPPLKAYEVETTLIQKIREDITDKIKKGKMFTSMVADHKKESAAFVKEIERLEALILELNRYKNFYDLHKEIRVEGMSKYVEVNKSKMI